MYNMDPETCLIDYDGLERLALEHKPKLITAGYSGYSRDLDYERLRKICDSVGAYLVVDMAHFSGLIAGGQVKDPFPYADVVSSCTHKSLNGPRSGIILSRKANGVSKAIDTAVFPMLQGGPHNNNIAALASAFKTA